MISAVVAGNLGKDAEVRQAGGQAVCSFNVASSTKVKGEDVTVWVRCSFWGKRGESVAQYLVKGSQVCASGALSTREHEGKTYLELNVSDLKLMGSKQGSSGGSGSGSGGSRSGAPKTGGSKPSGGGGFSDQDYGADADDVPFIASDYMTETERWNRCA